VLRENRFLLNDKAFMNGGARTSMKGVTERRVIELWAGVLRAYVVRENRFPARRARRNDTSATLSVNKILRAGLTDEYNKGSFSGRDRANL
jgi:hypothetical protein